MRPHSPLHEKQGLALSPVAPIFPRDFACPVRRLHRNGAFPMQYPTAAGFVVPFS
jgi:hypothetical protein